jgi:hypothetical protein
MEPTCTKLDNESIAEYVGRLNDSSSLDVPGFLREHPSTRIGWMTIVTRPAGTFFQSWIGRKRYKQGVRGFVTSVLEGLYTLAFYSKVWEYQMRRRTGGPLPPVTETEIQKRL